MKKYILALGVAVMIVPAYAMDRFDAGSGSEDSSDSVHLLDKKELDDIEALEGGVVGEDRHDALEKHAIKHSQKRRQKRTHTPIKDQLAALERGQLPDENPQLVYAVALCDREGVLEGIARKRIIDLIVEMDKGPFNDFVAKMGAIKRSGVEDKKFNLLLEMLVKAQEDASGEIKKQLEISQQQLEESKRQFAIQQKRADANQRRAILAGCIGGTGTVIASVIAIAKFVADGNA